MNGHRKSKINSPSTTLKTLVYYPQAKISNKCHVVLSLFLKLTLKHVPNHKLRKKKEKILHKIFYLSFTAARRQP